MSHKESCRFSQCLVTRQKWKYFNSCSSWSLWFSQHLISIRDIVHQRWFYYKTIQTLNGIFIFLMQTTVHFETENLEDAEVPIFVSLVAHPGFNTTCLESYGFFGDHDFFWGKRIFENESTTMLKWGDEENQSSIQSRLCTYHDKNLVIKNK